MPIRFLKILRKTWSKSSRESRVCFLLMLMITLHPLRSTTQLAMHWEYTLHPTTTTQQSHKQEPKHTHTEPCHRKRGERECVGGVRRSSLPGLIIAGQCHLLLGDWIHVEMQIQMLTSFQSPSLQYLQTMHHQNGSSLVSSVATLLSLSLDYLP